VKRRLGDGTTGWSATPAVLQPRISRHHRGAGDYLSARTVMSMLSIDFGLRAANGACTKSEYGKP
jgi:hypothetical protein